jgi:hypothetical protein
VVVDERTFAPLFEVGGDCLRPTGRIDRGESHVVADLAGPEETYASVRGAVAEGATRLERAAAADLTRPTDVTDWTAPTRGMSRSPGGRTDGPSLG